jgi:ABC-type transport system involved in multi-copper enzyme maturation permease subunit
MLIGPVFSAGSVTSERERQTLDLLLTTLLSPWKILWGKLFSGLRVSSVLTAFLLWPVLLAAIMVPDYWVNVLTILAYLVIVGITCLTTANVALMCSTLFKKTSTSLVVTYLILTLLFFLPLAADFFAQQYFPSRPVSAWIHGFTVASPFAAAHEFPLYVDDLSDSLGKWNRPASSEGIVVLGYALRDLQHFGGYLIFSVVFNFVVIMVMIWMFHARWRVSDLNR